MTEAANGRGLAVPGESVISTPQELAEAFGRWLAAAPPEETGEFIHRLIDHRRHHADSGPQPSTGTEIIEGGLVLGDPDGE